MAGINYSIAEMRNPKDDSQPSKFYAKMQATGTVDLDDLAEEISYATTLTDGDILNVLRALIRQIKIHLKNGKIVKLEKFGTFQFQICSTGAETESGFTTGNIKKVNIQFRPGKLLRESQNLSVLTFKKVAKKNAPTDDAPVNTDETESNETQDESSE